MTTGRDARPIARASLLTRYCDGDRPTARDPRDARRAAVLPRSSANGRARCC
jgi:hypothetical protein